MPKKKTKKKDYAKEAKRASVISGMTHTLGTKGNVKNTLLETGKDLLIGVVGGGLAGAAIGKPSLLIGMGITGAGHYTDNHLATLFGIGLMASNGFQKSKSVEGFDGMDGIDMQSVKERVNAYKENFLEKTYLDKVLHPGRGGKAKDETNGFGSLQFFNYPNDSKQVQYGMNNELSALDSIEHQIEQSGMAHMHNKGMNMGDLGDMGEVGDLNDFGETGDMGDLDYVDAKDYNL